MTEQSFSKQVVKNIAWLRVTAVPAQVINAADQVSEELKAQFVWFCNHGYHGVPLFKACEEFDKHLWLRPGSGLRIAKVLMWEGYLKCDLNVPKLHRVPVDAFLPDERAILRAA